MYFYIKQTLLLLKLSSYALSHQMMDNIYLSQVKNIKLLYINVHVQSELGYVVVESLQN